MNKTEIHQHIIKDIQEIYSFVNRFEQPNQIHQIDIDLALSKVRNLYDLLLKLNAHGAYMSEYQKEEKLTIHKPAENHQEQTHPEVLQLEEEKVILKEPEVESKPDPVIIIEKQEKKKEVIHPAEHKKDVVVKDEKPKKGTAKVKKTETSSGIVADKFQTKTSMHDSIGKDKTDKLDVSNMLKSKPIKDINSAIGLNDKFVFIRELFEGNKSHFSETIQVLNNFDKFENAITFLKENFKWDFEDSNVSKLVELVRRKYNA